MRTSRPGSVLSLSVRLLLRDAAGQQLSAVPQRASDRARRRRSPSRAPAAPSRRCRCCNTTATSLRSASGSAPWRIRSDLIDLPEESVAALAGIDLWIVDALWYRPHPSHFHLDLTLEWIDRIKPKRAILTNMHSDLDFEELRAKLPPHVEPGFDGMRVAFGE